MTKMRKNHWDTPLGLAVRHDKARARVKKLRADADRTEAYANELLAKYRITMAQNLDR